jgi:DNA-binding transcriptional MerR regulator
LPDATHLNAAACARKLGLTIRALRLYEQRGLVRPLRSEKGWRLYGPAQIARLAAIASLKSLGLGLAEIATLLRNDPPLENILRLRAQALRAEMARAQNALLLTEAALRLRAAGQSLSVEKLCDLIRSCQMQPLPKTFMDEVEKLYTPEEQAAMLARKMQMQDDPTHGGQAWAVLIAEVKQLIAANTDPASPPAQAAAQRWIALVKAFSGGDAAVEAKSAKLWQGALQADPQGRELPFGQSEMAFVQAAARSMRP